jgi:hypothetical protein
LSSSREIPGDVRQLDVDALHNLIDPTEEAFLRERLPAAEFDKIMAERMQAMIEYSKEGGDEVKLSIDS